MHRNDPWVPGIRLAHMWLDIFCDFRSYPTKMQEDAKMKHKDEKDVQHTVTTMRINYTSPQHPQSTPFPFAPFSDLGWNLVASHDDMKQDLIAEVELSQERVPSSPSMATELHLIDVFLLMVLT